MRSLLLLAVVLATAAMVSAAPVCPSLPVQLELHPQAHLRNGMSKYQLVFAAIDPKANTPEFVDIHYRVNNEDSINVRVLTQGAVTAENELAKQAAVDNIVLKPGDALRAYATYQAKGYACDTPVHTFNAPEPRRLVQEEMMTAEYPIRTVRPSWTNPRNTRAIRQVRNIDMMTPYESQFWAMAELEQQREMMEPTTQGVCPSITMDHDVLKIAGMRDTYAISFENKNPAKQLHYVDLHLTTDPAHGWDNLRMGSDMQLTMAHKVIQPGVVIKPDEVLHWYWSYRTATADGEIVDCTTPITSIVPQQVTHEVTMQALNAVNGL